MSGEAWEVHPASPSQIGREVGYKIADKGRRYWQTVADVRHPTELQQRRRGERGFEAGVRLVEERAALIVRAVNAHDDLLAVAEALLEAVGEDGMLSRLSEHSLLDVRDMAVKAIAKAGAK